MGKENVVVRKSSYKGSYLSVKRLKSGAFVSSKPPKRGYFDVIWTRKPKQLPKEVSTLFRSKKSAQRLASLLNAMTRREAIFLVKELYQKGGNDRASEINKNSRYSGRSFAWPT